MKGQLIDFKNLPSRGYAYPDDIEIYVKPLSVKEQIDMERYGVSDAEYFSIVLDGITIGGNFNKMNLLHSDVQFIDIVRRLYSFDINESITIKGCRCDYRDCQHEFDYTFKVQDLTFTDFNKDIFGKHFIFSEGTEDELEIVVSPVTINEYLSMSRRFRNFKDKKSSLSSMYAEYMCCCIREVVGRTFKDKKDRDAFIRDFINNLYLAKDKKTLMQITEESIVKLEPFKLYCEACDREIEVQVTPSSNFQQ